MTLIRTEYLQGVKVFEGTVNVDNVEAYQYWVQRYTVYGFTVILTFEDGTEKTFIPKVETFNIAQL